MIFIEKPVAQQVATQARMHILAHLLFRFLKRHIPHRHKEIVMVAFHYIVDIIVNIRAECRSGSTVMDMIEHFGRVAVHGLSVAQTCALVGLHIDGDKIIERAIASFIIDQTIVFLKRQTVHQSVAFEIIAHLFQGFHLLEHSESIERVFFLSSVAVDIYLRHVHGQHQLRIAVAYDLIVELIDVIKHIVDYAGSRASESAAHHPVEDNAVLAAHCLHIIEPRNGCL